MPVPLRSSLVICALLAVGLIVRPAAAQSSGPTVTVVDQSYDPPTNRGANINEGSRYVAESYTAGITGLLSGVQVDIHSFGGSTSPLEITLLATTNGQPNGLILGQTQLSGASSPFS